MHVNFYNNIVGSLQYSVYLTISVCIYITDMLHNRIINDLYYVTQHVNVNLQYILC